MASSSPFSRATIQSAPSETVMSSSCELPVVQYRLDINAWHTQQIISHVTIIVFKVFCLIAPTYSYASGFSYTVRIIIHV